MKLLTPAELNLYHIKENIIKLRTAAWQCSDVELVAIADQFPEWFISHWWGGGACIRFDQMFDQTCKRSRIELGYSILDLCK